jgi:hypothetical protein
MGQRTLSGDDLGALRAEHDRRVNRPSPRAARAAGDWPIVADHCFARVVLDATFEDVRYDHVDGRPAHDHLSPAELRRAIDVAGRLLRADEPPVTELNRRPLRYRGESVEP